MYNVEGNIVKSETAYKHPPFLTSNTRFEVRNIEHRPGPQSYDPK
jgi:hypothetical protein